MSTTETTQTPAALLRKAAADMRERAQAATPGPWWPVAGVWQTETFAAVIGPEGVAEDAETWLMATGRGPVSQEADADHAASWHPLVALAVAEWLDAAADTAMRYEAERAWMHPDSYALKVARAYLGETVSGEETAPQPGQVPSGHPDAGKSVGWGEHPRDCDCGDCP